MVKPARLSTFVGVALTAMVVSCRPDMEGRPSLIDGPTILALRSLPAEAAPGELVGYEALVVSADAEVDSETLSWQACLLRKPLTTAGAIHPECLNEKGAGIVALGSGLGVESAVVDVDACKLFGPTPPDAVAGGAMLRAADPDSTGGYYQPVVLRQSSDANESYSIGVTRLACGLGAATQEQVVNYNQHYRRNENPRVEDIRVGENNEAVSIAWDDENVATNIVAAGSTVHLEAAWPSCSRKGECGDGVCSLDEAVEDCAEDCTNPHGCYGAEPYLVFEPSSRRLVEKREHLRVSWYATSGRFAHDRTAANVSDRDNVSANDWIAPLTAGMVRFWVVLRDDRRGVGWQAFDLRVEK